MNNQSHWRNLRKDLLIIIFSVITAVLLAKTEILKEAIAHTQEIKFLSSFLAGFFFISIFTAAPIAVILVEIFKTNSILMVSFFAGLGAVAGDLLIFRFVKNHLTEDLLNILNMARRRRTEEIFKRKIFRWLMPFVGALIIASPLPDELGVMLMGLSKTKTKFFIPLSFILNFLGILIIGLATKNLTQ